MKLTNFITHIIFLTLLVGCGGGSESSSQAPENNESNTQTTDSSGNTETNETLDTTQLVAPQSFDFRVDKDVRISFTDLPQTNGVINIYHGTDFYDEQNDIYYPDGKTLLTSWRPKQTKQINVSFNRNWQGLLIEWLPQTGFEKEQYLFFPASQINEELLLSINAE